MAKIKKLKKTLRIARWRFWVQASFLLVWLDPLLVRWHGVCAPVFHCYSCPLTTFNCPIRLLIDSCALYFVPFLTIGILVVVGSLFGSLICGWVCPFGFLQDLIGRIPTPKLRLPGWMGWARYAVLIGLVLIVPYYIGEKITESNWLFCNYCPVGAVEAAVPYSVQQSVATHSIVWLSTTKTIVVVGFFLAALFIYRPWCTVLCPLGAIFSIFNYVSLVFLRFQPDRCNDCDLCSDICKYHGPSEQRGGDLRCIRCMECTQCKALSVGNVFQKEENLVKITSPSTESKKQ